MLPRLIFLFTLFSCIVNAGTPPDWSRAFPAHKIVGNVYYVGTEGLACYLITAPQGHVLINTGLADSVPLIRKSVESLGYRFADIRMLLTMQAHYDHVAGMAEVQKLTGAKMLATEGDAPVLADGGRSDYHFGKEFWFAPVRVDKKLRDGEIIRLDKTEITVHLTPGHTKGSVTYSIPVSEGGRVYQVLMANMGSINPGVTLLNNPHYPAIAADYAHAFAVQKALLCDIFLSAHPSQYGLLEKFHPGQPYRADTFVDPAGYRKAVEAAERTYRQQLAAEQQAHK